MQNEKLKPSLIIPIGLMLFSFFFGAGNLIFPPVLGQMAGENIGWGMLGFCLSGVGFPLLGVLAVAMKKSDNPDAIAMPMHPLYARAVTILCALAIGPLFAIPRTAAVSFDTGISALLPAAFDGFGLPLYSAFFFILTYFFSINPSKIIGNIGNFLSPMLLICLTVLVVCVLVNPTGSLQMPNAEFTATPFFRGFQEGYNTMDTIAALNFGLVISTTLGAFGLKEKRDKMRCTVLAGVLAGAILVLVYAALAYMGMCSSGVYEIQENGAWTLRCIVYQVFGKTGAVLLAAIFTLACLTTCVGLINSISQYFSVLFRRVSYRAWVLIITFFSFLVCNLGLNMILSISVPVLNAIYPVAIVLILLGLSHRLWKKNRYAYPMTVAGTAAVSIVYALDGAGVPLGFLGRAFDKLPLYGMGFGWVSVAGGMLLLSLVLKLAVRRKSAGE